MLNQIILDCFCSLSMFNKITIKTYYSNFKLLPIPNNYYEKVKCIIYSEYAVESRLISMNLKTIFSVMFDNTIVNLL